MCLLCSQGVVNKSQDSFEFQEIHSAPIHSLFSKTLFFRLRWVFVSAQAFFSRCRQQGLLFVAVRGFLIAAASLAVKHRLLSAQASVVALAASVAPPHVGSSRIRDRTCVLCVGRQVLYH